MVVEMSPWSSNLGLMVAHPIFCLKISHFKAKVRTVAHPWMYKQVFQIQRILLRLGIYFPDFGITRKVPWPPWGGCHMPRSHKQWRELPTFAILFFCVNCHKSVIHFWRLWHFMSGCSTLAYRSRHRHRVIAKSTGSGDPVFTLMDALLYGP
jgi:hypothetical protein